MMTGSVDTIYHEWMSRLRTEVRNQKSRGIQTTHVYSVDVTSKAKVSKVHEKVHGQK